MFVSCFVLGLFSVRPVSLFVSLSYTPVLPSVRRSVYPSVYLSPSYVDVARRQSGLLTLLSVSLAHLLGFLFKLAVKELKLLKQFKVLNRRYSCDIARQGPSSYSHYKFKVFPPFKVPKSLNNPSNRT